MTYNERHQRQHVKVFGALDCELWAQGEIFFFNQSLLCMSLEGHDISELHFSKL